MNDSKIPGRSILSRNARNVARERTKRRFQVLKRCAGDGGHGAMPWVSRLSTSVACRVALGRRAAFTDCMDHVARSRRRTGALAWWLSHDGNEPVGRSISPNTTGSRPPTGAMRRGPRLMVKVTAAEVTHAFDAAAGPVVSETEGTADARNTSG